MLSSDAILLRMNIGYSLVDITQTNIVASVQTKERNQQRNFETLVQVLSLRTQLLTLSDPQIVSLDVTGSSFGSNYAGVQSVWTFKFSTEQEDVFKGSSRPYGTLEADFVNVPVITGLDETVAIPVPTFIVSGPNTNIYFEPFSI
jgi:hypothetical protein